MVVGLGNHLEEFSSRLNHSEDLECVWVGVGDDLVDVLDVLRYRVPHVGPFRVVVSSAQPTVLLRLRQISQRDSQLVDRSLFEVFDLGCEVRFDQLEADAHHARDRLEARRHDR